MRGSFRFPTVQPRRELGPLCDELEGSFARRDAQELVPRMRSSAGGGGAGASPRGLPSLWAWVCGEGVSASHPCVPFRFHRLLSQVEGLNSGQALPHPPLLTFKVNERESGVVCVLTPAPPSDRGWAARSQVPPPPPG